jgi:uncharacterized protein YrrD
MLRSTDQLKGLHLSATDGEIGRVEDAYFDDHSWTVRYLVVDTGGWLTGRKVLISPDSVQSVSWDTRWVSLNLDRDQVRNSPDIDTDKPVSRLQEALYADYYGYQYYWSRPYLGGFQPRPMPPEMAEQIRKARMQDIDNADPNLRSVNEVTGYHIEATGGRIGHVENFLFNETDWQMEYLVVDTRDWLPGKHVLVELDFVQSVHWAERAVVVDLSKETIRSRPKYEDFKALSELDEQALDAYCNLAKRAQGDARPRQQPAQL